MAIPIQYIHRQLLLDDCLNTLSAAKRLAFDLEFDRDRYSYGFDLCLVQIATPEVCYVIDPLAGLNLEPFFRLLENSSAIKLVHSPGEDLRLLHSLQCYPTQLVDTEVLARWLNYEQSSLSNMLQMHCGVALNKKLQTSNWARRPLSPAQIDYAAADVLYLFELYDKLLALMAPKGLLPMAQQDFDQLNAVRYQLDNKVDFLKKNDRQFMSPYDQYVLNELFKFRDSLARERNKPAHQIMAEEVLRQIAYRRLPIAGVPNEPGVHPYLKSAMGLQQLGLRWKQIEQEAIAATLSRKRPGSCLSAEEKAAFERERTEIEFLKKTLFVPIQHQLSARFGEFTSRYILSTTLVNEVLKRNQRIHQLQPAYKPALIKEAAETMHVDISPWW